jgi:hypothetical protein
VNVGSWSETDPLSLSEMTASSSGTVAAVRVTVSLADASPAESADDTVAVLVTVSPTAPDVVAAGTDTCGKDSPAVIGDVGVYVQSAVFVVVFVAEQSHPLPDGVPART